MNKCQVCASPSGFNCPCGRAQYCGRQCQKYHWKTHKGSCTQAYTIRVDSILAQVLREFPDLDATMEDDYKGGLASQQKLKNLVINRNGNRRQCVTILVDDTPARIILRVKHSVEHCTDTECPICFEEGVAYAVCTQCDGIYCQLCFIRLFAEYDGIIRCPHCRYEYGDRHVGTGKYVKICEIAQRIYIPELGNIQTHMNKTADRAEELYHSSVLEILENQDGPPDPTTWIYNQVEMRRVTESMRVMVSGNKFFEKSGIVLYNEFMHTNYPASFGKLLRIGIGIGMSSVDFAKLYKIAQLITP
jgi:hypothetical protein